MLATHEICSPNLDDLMNKPYLTVLPETRCTTSDGTVGTTVKSNGLIRSLGLLMPSNQSLGETAKFRNDVP